MFDEARAPGSPDFGALLRRYRLAAGLSQEGLAERARMSTNGISALERGYRRTPQRETLGLLADALALRAEQRREFEAAAHSGLPRSGSGTSNLPLALTTFVGREAELDEVAALVRGYRLVTLTGAGGVGKTQTALHVGSSLRDGSGSVVCFVGLAPVGDRSLVVATIAAAIGVQEVPSRPLLETLLVYLRNKPLLLILDNCEHVVAEAATFAEAVLAGCPLVRIFATSREPLRAAGEYTYRLPSLRVPTAEASRKLSATHASEYGAMVLFADRARAVDRHFSLTDENASTIADICRHLDGIPLAIELAAARVNSLSVRALAARLDDRLRILTGGERTALPRQQTMRATIDWSYDLLSPPEQRLFERLSVFAGGCTLATAMAVCAGEEIARPGVPQILASLVDKSLVAAELDGDDCRYRLLESSREYAREKLAQRGERELIAHRHAHAMLDLAERLGRAYDAEPDEVWRALGREELDNWRAALQWTLIERGDILLGRRLVGELTAVWQNFVPLEGRRWLVRVFELPEEPTPPEILAGFAYAEAIIASQLREYRETLASSESAIARYRMVGDRLGVARAQTLASYALMSLGRVADAAALLRETLEMARNLDNRRLLAYTLRCLAYIGAAEDDFAAARHYVAEALQIYEAMGAKLKAAWAMDDLGEYEFCAGNAELAVSHATRALATFRSFDDMRGGASVLSNASGYLVSLGRYDEAYGYAREALELAREHHVDALTAHALQNLAAIGALRPRVDPTHAAAARGAAARILGFVDARLASMGSARPHAPAQQYVGMLAMLRDALGTDAVASLMADGTSMTQEQAVEEALEI